MSWGRAVGPAVLVGLWSAAGTPTPAGAETPTETPTVAATVADAEALNRRFRTESPASLASFLERQSREVFARREAVVQALQISPGDAVADVGAGTGAYLDPLARAVGPRGRLVLVEIAPQLVAHLKRRAANGGWDQVEVLLGTDRSANLPPNSLDLVFTADTYHHFAHPAAMNASIYRALRPGGRYVVLDFERRAGKSRPWVLEHVRTGRRGVIREVRAAGFEAAGELQVEGLVENYVLVFRKPEPRGPLR